MSTAASSHIEVSPEDVYRRVAGIFAATVEKAFTSEATLQELHDSYFPGLPFDRTLRMNHVLRQELSKVWLMHGLEVKAQPTSWDIRRILDHLVPLLDYNLFTQVFLNLNPGPAIRYLCAEAESELSALRRSGPRSRRAHSTPSQRCSRLRLTPRRWSTTGTCRRSRP